MGNVFDYLCDPMLMREIQMQSDLFNTTLGHVIGEKNRKRNGIITLPLSF